MTGLGAPSSSNDVELHFFGCGHGDTILIRSPSNKWGLIDCHLPKQCDTHRRFFEYVESLGIRRLEFVLLTHPDQDHFLGMVDVIKYFTTGGRELKYFCICGAHGRRLKHKFLDRPEENEYSHLMDLIRQLDKQDGIVKRRGLHANANPITFSDNGITVVLHPIAPDYGDFIDLQEDSARAIGAKLGGAKLEANAYSVVLALVAKSGSETWHFLLTGDADRDPLRKSIKVWQNMPDCCDSNGFDGLKVPHHGSVHSHLSELCSLQRDKINGGGCAIVTSGTRRHLPAVKVLEEYINNKWHLYATTTRHGIRQPSGTLAEAVGVLSSGNQSCVRHDIVVKWNPAAGLRVQPAAARVEMHHLAAYR